MHMTLFNSLCSAKLWILILLLLVAGRAYFFDLKRNPNKDWTTQKIVLNDALYKYNHSGGSPTMHTKFKHHTSFCCNQEPHESSSKSGYNVMFLMDDYVRSESLLKDHESLNTWSTQLESGEHN